MTIFKDERMYPSQCLISGGVAGVLARSLTSPFDVVKILAQVGTEESKKGFLASWGLIFRREGSKAFWKGNGIACARLFPYSAIQFYVYSKTKSALSGDERKIDPLESAIAGSVAGILATVRYTVYYFIHLANY